MTSSVYLDDPDHYKIKHWGEGYFSINSKGEVTIKPQAADAATEVSLIDICASIENHRLKWPVLVRFPDILKHRVNQLCDSFNQVAEDLGYRGHYTAVYPVKVNQQRRVVEEIVSAEPARSQNQIGLEAGSKPELLAVLAHCPANATIICNGYKDREFIRLALIGQAMGLQVYVVIEKPGELDLLLRRKSRFRSTTEYWHQGKTRIDKQGKMAKYRWREIEVWAHGIADFARR